MYEVSNLFLLPVLFLILALFFYSIFQIGVFATQVYTRRKNSVSKAKGYIVFNHATDNNIANGDDLEVFAFSKLEVTTIVTRVAPMLGLVATMIPMGPAFKALSNGNIQGVSDNLIVAFSAVIFSLLTASITFWITAVRKRWYANEIREYMQRFDDETLK
jgi:biopolymer transport protein ExbB/TolQ